MGGRGVGESMEVVEDGRGDGDNGLGNIGWGDDGSDSLECWSSRRGDGVAVVERMK